MKIAAIQMVSGTDVQANLRHARELLETAARQGVELAVLPEYFCLMGQHDHDKLAIREPFGAGPLQKFAADAARQLGLWIVAGSLPLTPEADDDGAHVCNSSLVFAPDGTCRTRYDKIHLFRYRSADGGESYDESAVLCPGTHPVQFDLPSADGNTWRIGLGICYDLRFPELFRAHAKAGAQLLLLPSAFTWETGLAHWTLLLRARAVENLAWMLGAAQAGRHDNGRRTFGHSMLVDPWGQIQAMHAEGAAVVAGEINFEHMQALRARLPALQHAVL